VEKVASKGDSMRIKRALIALTIGLVFALGGLATNALRAQPVATLALTGKVTSATDGAMEGVLVSAKRADSTITVTVVTDAQGAMAFRQRDWSRVTTR